MNNDNLLQWSELEPLCLLRWLLKNAWLVVLAALIGYFAASAYLLGDASRSYSSSATFAVMSRPGGAYISSTAASTEAAQDYADLLKSDVMKKAVWTDPAQRAGLTIAANVPDKTNLIQVTVTAETPEAALLGLQQLMGSYTTLSDYVASDAILTVLSAPTIAVRTNRTIAPQTLLRFTVLLGIGAMGAALVFVYLQTATVQTPKSARSLLDAPLLASIDHNGTAAGWFFRREEKGQRALLTAPSASFAFAESIQRLATKLEHEKINGKSVFLFTSVSQGEGKSTVAANAALALAMKQEKVLLIDLDLRRPVQAAALGMARSADQSLGTLLGDGTSPREILALAEQEPESGLWALLNRKSFSNAAELLSSQTLAELIALARESCDYVIIDLPPVGFFADGEELADLCDASVLVVRQDLVPAGAVNDAIDNLRSGQAELLGCVLNDVRLFSNGRSGYGYGHYGYGKYGYGKYGYGGEARRDRSQGKAAEGKAWKK